MVIKERDVWNICRKYGGISVRYGSMDIYECIFENHLQCCLVILADNEAFVSKPVEVIAHSISKKCFCVWTLESVERVIKDLVLGKGRN